MADDAPAPAAAPPAADKPKLSRGEILAALGGILLGISIFVKTYETRPENPNAQIDGRGGPNPADGITPGDGTYTIWAVHNISRILLLLAAIAPFILIYIVLRQHSLSWPRGEVTMVVGLTAATLLFYTGIVDRPGEPSGQIELEIGWYGAFLGAVMIAVGGTMASMQVSTRKRKPPGMP